MWSTGPDEMMAGGAMLLQCFPSRSAESELPSRISMKSYLQNKPNYSGRMWGQRASGVNAWVIVAYLTLWPVSRTHSCLSVKWVLATYTSSAVSPKIFVLTKPGSRQHSWTVGKKNQCNKQHTKINQSVDFLTPINTYLHISFTVTEKFIVTE